MTGLVENITELAELSWNQLIVPSLCNYIKIPNKSPAFDPEWQKHPYMDQAFALVLNWCQTQNVKNLKAHIHRAANRTPLLILEIPGQIDKTVLLYGHLDKQPEMYGWDEGLGPWQPVIRENRLYGRGSADDGYAVYAALTSVRILQQLQIPHARCVILIEGSEESASPDLPYYVAELKHTIGVPDLIVCLDSGAGNYEQLWCTTSLRGLINGKLNVEILKQGVHSGAASGFVPSSFRILRQLLSRIENEETGKILPKALQVNIPRQRQQEAQQVARALGKDVWSHYPFVDNAKPVASSGYELVLNRTWRAALSVIGMEGIPSLNNAGNVLRPSTAAMLSLRLPPTCDAKGASRFLQKELERSPPYRAKVEFEVKNMDTGWNAPALKPWLMNAVQHASQAFFGKKAMFWGEGGSIPFMGMLGKMFPGAQFVVTGVLGPHSNAHGPNEFLHLPTAKKLTSCVAFILAQHFKQFS